MEIPEQLRKPEFRFVLLGKWNEWINQETKEIRKVKPKDYEKYKNDTTWLPMGKMPFEKDWQKKGYQYDDPKLLEHIKKWKNIGVIGGYGNLRILDIDDPALIEHFDVEQTFVDKTGGGGRHIYFISDYDKNHVLAGDKGELRAKNYQVVCPRFTHPSGKKYEIVKDLPIKTIEGKELKKIIEPFLRSQTLDGTIDVDRPTDKTRSGKEFGEVCRLIRKGWDKKRIFERMMIFAKWSHAKPQYRELTYNKAKNKINTNGIKQTKQTKQTKQQQNDKTTIKSGGSVSKDFVIEPIGDGWYLYNVNGKRGTKQAKQNKENRIWYLEIEDKEYVFEEAPIKKLMFSVPDAESINAYAMGEYKIKSSKEIFHDLLEYFKLWYDVDEKYYPILALGSLQSWLTPFLNTVSYIGLEAKRGAGKTSIIEGLAIVSRHGFLVGNPTEAIARDIDAQQLSVFCDEIDKRTQGKDNAMYQCFRQGYRRKNVYLRHKEKSFDPELYDPFGFKGFTLHTDIEKALKDRSIMMPTRVTTDKRLPVLNIAKEYVGLQILKDLFFFYMDNASNLFSSFSSFSLLPIFERKDLTINQKRQMMYEEITKHFSESEIKLLGEFIGRNIEILFIALTVCKTFNINLEENLKEVITEKQSYDDVSDNYLIDLLADYLKNIVYGINKGVSEWRLKKGTFIGRFFYPKVKAYEEFRQILNDKGLTRFGSTEFTEYLRELNFEDKVNIKMERIPPDFDKLKKCLIFDSSVLKLLDIDDKPEQTKLGDSE